MATSIGNMFQQSYLDQLKQGLHAYSLRHRVVADNIANVETQGYQAQRIEFEEAMQRSGQGGPRIPGIRTNDGHMALGNQAGFKAPEMVEIAEGYDNGINDVSVEREMGELAKNDLSFRLATRMLGRQYQQLRMAINGETRG